MMKKIFVSLCVSFLLILSFNGCIAFRSDMQGTFSSNADKAASKPPVSVFFHFSHLELQRGFDVVPKISFGPHSFNDIFSESLREFSNIKSYKSFTDAQYDAEDFNRRHLRDSLQAMSDFTIHLTIQKENSFTKHFFSDLLTICSLSVIPTSFTWDYSITADVTNPAGKVLKSYSRQFSLNQWDHALFMFIYPFYPNETKTDEIYFEALHNIFRQIEAEGVLSK